MNKDTIMSHVITPQTGMVVSRLLRTVENDCLKL